MYLFHRLTKSMAYSKTKTKTINKFTTKLNLAIFIEYYECVRLRLCYSKIFFGCTPYLKLTRIFISLRGRICYLAVKSPVLH